MKKPPSRDFLHLKKENNSEIRELSRDRQNSKNIKLSRNNSVDSIRKRVASQGENRSMEMQKKQMENSREKAEKGKAFMEDISNRCK